MIDLGDSPDYDDANEELHWRLMQALSRTLYASEDDEMLIRLGCGVADALSARGIADRQQELPLRYDEERNENW